MRTFHKMPAEVKEEMVWELEEAANPVKMAAQAKAPGSMSNMVKTREWSAMKVGITRKNPGGDAADPVGVGIDEPESAVGTGGDRARTRFR